MKLTDIDPKTVARAAVRKVQEHLHHVAFQLSPGLTLRIEGDEGCTDLGMTVETLAHYAQKGLPVWDWTDHGMASDGLLSALSALYGSACGDLGKTAIDVVDDVDPADELGLVLVAAAARVRLEQRVGLTARELGALAGIGAAGVRHYLRSGELVTDGGRPARVKAKIARQWLAARGVAGV